MIAFTRSNGGKKRAEKRGVEKDAETLRSIQLSPTPVLVDMNCIYSSLKVHIIKDIKNSIIGVKSTLKMLISHVDPLEGVSQAKVCMKRLCCESKEKESNRASLANTTFN